MARRNQINNYHDIQEVVAVAVNNTAEFARVGYFDMTTKSGTNKLHVGPGFTGIRTLRWARATSSPPSSRSPRRTPSIANAAGPIRKDKTFFYVAYNAQRWPGGIFYTRNVPTNQMRAGDFSELLAASRPVTVKIPSITRRSPAT